MGSEMCIRDRNIVYNDVALAPCTAAAAIELIHATGLTVEGLEVVIIGHSEIVGKPIAMMLMAEGATVRSVII